MARSATSTESKYSALARAGSLVKPDCVFLNIFNLWLHTAQKRQSVQWFGKLNSASSWHCKVLFELTYCNERIRPSWCVIQSCQIPSVQSWDKVLIRKVSTQSMSKESTERNATLLSELWLGHWVVVHYTFPRPEHLDLPKSRSFDGFVISFE